MNVFVHVEERAASPKPDIEQAVCATWHNFLSSTTVLRPFLPVFLACW